MGIGFWRVAASPHNRLSATVRRIGVTGIGACAVWIGALAPSQAQDRRDAQDPNAGSLYSSLLPADRQEVADDERLGWTLNKLPSQTYMREVYWQMPSDVPAFFRDSLLQVVARTYYFNQNNFDGSKTQAWTAGGWVAYRSGLIGDLFGIHAAYYTSQPLFAPLDEDGTKLLAPGQNSLGMLGQAYGRLQIHDQEIRGGAQLVDTPLINPSDNRMVPNTFLGTTMVSLPDSSRYYDYSLGYLWSIKQRDSNDFIPMSDALNAGEENRGALYGMIKYRPPVPGLSTVFMDYQVADFVNTAFGQVEYDFRRPKGEPNWIVGANVIDQRSVGENLLIGVPFETYQASGKVQMVYAGWTLFGVASITGDGSSIFSPFGTKPNYTDMQQVSFDNANEKAVGASFAYDFGYAFSKIGLNGLSAGAWYTRGWDAINATTLLAIPDRQELDLWLQYRPSEGLLKGLRVKVQYSDLWQQGNVNSVQPQFRFIVDYTVLFRPPIVASK